MTISKKTYEKTDAVRKLKRLKKLTENHEKWCSCEPCTEYANAEIDFAFEYGDYGKFM